MGCNKLIMYNISLRKYKLVVFDCDGVLIDGHVSFYVADKLNIGTKIREIYRDLIIGLKNFSQAVNESLNLFLGLKESEIYPILNTIPLMSGTEETITTLKRSGFIVGAITTGASQYFVDILKHRLNLDFALGTFVKSKDGVFTGISPPIINVENKDYYFEKVAESYSCNLSECIAIGDDFSNISLFKKVGFSIAFNTGCLTRELQMLDLPIKNKLILNSKLASAELNVKHNAHIVLDTQNLTTILSVFK